MKFILTLFILSTVFLSVNCSVTESENIKTSGVWAHYRIEMDPDGDILAWAVLRVGGATGTIIDLSGGEHMECNGVTMTEYMDLITNYHWNRAQVSEDPESLYDFVFVRTDEEVSSTLELPEMPLITSIENEATLTDLDDITVYWDDTVPGDYVNIFLSGDCIDDIAEYNVMDNGSFTIQDILYLETFSVECHLDLTVSRIIDGVVNSDFQGGLATGAARDSVDLLISEATL